MIDKKIDSRYSIDYLSYFFSFFSSEKPASQAGETSNISAIFCIMEISIF